MKKVVFSREQLTKASQSVNPFNNRYLLRFADNFRKTTIDGKRTKTLKIPMLTVNFYRYLGLIIGDGTPLVYRFSRTDGFAIRLKSYDEEILRWCKQHFRGTINHRQKTHTTYSLLIWSFLKGLRLRRQFAYRMLNDLIDVADVHKKIALIGGFADAEGSVSGSDVYLGTNNDRRLINIFKRVCDDIGIPVSITKKTSKTMGLRLRLRLIDVNKVNYSELFMIERKNKRLLKIIQRHKHRRPPANHSPLFSLRYTLPKLAH